MKIISETRLRDFKFRSGAKETASLLGMSEFDAIEEYLEEIHPDGIDEGTLNDFFWFEDEWIANFLGYESYEEMFEERKAKFKSKYDF